MLESKNNSEEVLLSVNGHESSPLTLHGPQHSKSIFQLELVIILNECRQNPNALRKAEYNPVYSLGYKNVTEQL